MKRSQKDPFGALRKTAIALTTFLFVFLGFVLFMLSYISSAHRVEEKKKQQEAVHPKQHQKSKQKEILILPEEIKEGERLLLRALELVRLKKWDALYVLSEGAASLPDGVLNALLSKWTAWPPEEEERAIACAGLLEAAIAQKRSQTKRIYQIMKHKLIHIVRSKQSIEAKSLALKVLASFSTPSVEQDLHTLFSREKDEMLRSRIAVHFSKHATRQTFGYLLSQFQSSKDPLLCAEISLILLAVHTRQPDPSFAQQKKEILIPKLESFTASDAARSVLEKLK